MKHCSRYQELDWKPNFSGFCLIFWLLTTEGVDNLILLKNNWRKEEMIHKQRNPFSPTTWTAFDPEVMSITWRFFSLNRYVLYVFLWIIPTLVFLSTIDSTIHVCVYFPYDEHRSNAMYEEKQDQRNEMNLCFDPFLSSRRRNLRRRRRRKAIDDFIC